MRLPRMTTRRWMIAVAVVAVAMGGIVGVVRLNRRRQTFRDRAAQAELMADGYRELADRSRRVAGFLDGVMTGGTTPEGSARQEARRNEWLRDKARYDRLAAYYAEMADKYRQAARRFRMPVEPDLPKPD